MSPSPAGLPPMTLRQRGSFAAHLWKAVTQQHHRQMQPVFEPFVPADAIVFDVGAHAGQYAKLFAGLAPEGKIYAFEPSGYARGILQRVVRWRRLRNVEIVAAGLSDTPGTLDLSTPLKRTGSFGFGLAHFGAETRFGKVWRETVPIRTIDDFCRDRDVQRVDFVKADIEGWEVRMLQGATETIKTHRPVILVELVDDFLGRAGNEASEVFDMLEPLGYSAFAVGADARPRPVTRYEGPDDYLFASRADR